MCVFNVLRAIAGTYSVCSLLVVPIFRYHDGGVYVIDVSQSVEHDHPCALEFLRKDCTNVTGQLKDFFWLKSTFISKHFNYGLQKLIFAIEALLFLFIVHLRYVFM